MTKNKFMIFVIALIIIPSFVQAERIEFKDIEQKDWYYNDVVELVNKEIIKGYKDSTFRPLGNITRSEALSLIFRVNNIDIGYSDGVWDQAIKDKAYEKGVIDSEIYKGNEYITKQEFVELLVNTDDINVKTSGSNKFNDTNNKYINYLSDLGVVNGVKIDDKYKYYPKSKITRAQASVILNKYIYTKQKQSTNKDKLEIKDVLSVSEIDESIMPLSKDEFEKMFMGMASRNTFKNKIEYKGYSLQDIQKVSQEELVKAFRNIQVKYPEYYSFTNNIKININNKVQSTNLELELTTNELHKNRLESIREEYFELAEKELKGLIDSGKITGYMTDREKARVIYDWIILNTEYDFTLSPLSFTGYGQLKNGEAVCQGYTSTYNLMLKMLGIEVTGVTGYAGSEGHPKDSHIWSKAKLDGEWYYIDVTFGDPYNMPIDYIDERYFMVSEEFLRKTHTFE